MRILRFGMLAGMLLVSVRCSKPAPDYNAGISVFVSIPPQRYFVEKIGGEFCRVRTLIPAGASPHTFEPKPRQMAELAKARLYFSVGVEMERAWLPKLRSVAPKLFIVATDSGIDKRGMEENEHDGDHAGSDGHEQCQHGGVDPHIWLSPELVKQQAAIIVRALAAVDTQHAAVYRRRYAHFMIEIDTLQRRIADHLEQCEAPERFLVLHPSWGYFAHAFGLRQIAIEVEGKEPGVRRLAEIVSMAKRDRIQAVLVQPQFSARTAGVIAKRIGGTVVTADPLAEDWAENLERIAGILCAR